MVKKLRKNRSHPLMINRLLQPLNGTHFRVDKNMQQKTNKDMQILVKWSLTIGRIRVFSTHFRDACYLTNLTTFQIPEINCGSRLLTLHTVIRL